MDTSPLLGYEVILFNICTLLILFMFGYIVAYFLQSVFSEEDTTLPFNSSCHLLPTLVTLYFGLGLLGLLFMFSIVLLLPGFILWKIYLIVILTTIFFVYSIYVQRKSLKLNIKKGVEKSNWRKFFSNLVFFGLVVYGIFHYLIPALGFYAYPGVDDVAPALLSKSVLETGNLPFIDYIYPEGGPSWGWKWQCGTPVLTAFFTPLYGTTIAKTHLFLLQLNRALTPLFVYAFVTLLLKEQNFREKQLFALLSMFWSIFAIARFRYFYWGGIGESIGYNIALTFLIFYLLVKKKFKKRKNLSLTTKAMSFLLFFATSIILVTYIGLRVLPLYVTGLFSLLLLELWRRDLGWKLRMAMFGCMVGIFYGIASIGATIHFPLFHTINPFITFSRNEGHLVLLSDGSITSWIARSITQLRSCHGWYSPLLLSFASLSLFLGFRKNKDLKLMFPFLGFWLLFFLSQNHPQGIYCIPIPGILLWTGDLLRIYYLFSLYLSMLFGFSFTIALMNLATVFKHFGKTFFDLLKKKNLHSLRIIALISLIPFLVFASTLHLTNVIASYRVDRKIALKRRQLTQKDLEAFCWIRHNIKGQHRFLTSGYDGGKWIPIYTDQITVGSPRIGYPDSPSFNKLIGLLVNGSVGWRVRSLLERFAIDFVYVGIVQSYSHYPGTFNRSALLEGAYFELVWREGKVMIFTFS